LGKSALGANTTGAEHTAVGNAAGDSVTTGIGCTLLGYSAGAGVTTGNANTFVGHNACLSVTSGIANTVVGAANNMAGGTNYAMGLGYNLTMTGGYTTLGNASSDSRLSHGGTSWAAVSDERYKKDIVDSTAGLSFINALQPRTWKYKTLGELPETFRAYKADSTEVFKNSVTNHGFIAQEVKAAIDADSGIADGFKLWDDREDGSQEVAEAALIPVLTKAIQELSTQLDAALARITTLEG